MIQLQAGYISQAIIEDFYNSKNSEKFKKLFNYLCHFDVETDDVFDIENPDSIAVLVDRLISRGLPTFPSSFIEDIISNTFLKIKKVSEGKFFRYGFVNDELKEEIIRAFHIIEPRISVEDFKYDAKDKSLEHFFKEYIPQNIGEYMLQLFSYGRNFRDILKNEIEEKNYENKLLDTNLELTAELPYEINENKGVTVEYITEKDYLNSDQISKQNLNEFLDKSGWKSNMLITDGGLWDSEVEKFTNATFDDFFDNLRRNYKSPLYNNEYGLNAMQIALTPIAIARIQKIIVQYILSGRLNINAKELKIAVIERDVPAAFLAIEDLKQNFNHLLTLEDKNREFPKIDLTIYNTPEFEEAELNILYQGKLFPLEEFNSKEKYDLLIDLSILLRSSVDFEEVKSSALNEVKIRSAQYINSERKFYTNKKINYNLSVLLNNHEKTTSQKNKEKKFIESLNFFARNIFRKNKLTSRQYRFVANTITDQNSLNVIPSKEDKYFIYQFSSLFQPGVSIIITPLMSTLKWQFDAIRKYAIDPVTYFSAYTDKVIDKHRALTDLENSRILFTFVTPDRLHIPEYRKTLKRALENEIHFSNIFIDEAHCSSEWSHDFRALYATIFNNIKIIFEEDTPSFKCLTETASYDVVEDLKIKYQIESNCIIKNDSVIPNTNIEILNYNYQYSQDKKTEKEVNDIKISLIKEKLPENSVCILTDPVELYSIFQNKNASVFEGTIGDRLKTISTVKSKKSYSSLRDFQNKQTDYLFGTFTLGFGINYNAKNIVFADLPFSTELFNQTLIRFSPELKNIYLVNTKDKIYNTQVELEFDEFANIVEKQFSAEVPVEEVFRYKSFDKLYFSTKKNLNILKELTSEITFPTESIEQMLTRRIRYAFDIWIRLESQPEEEPTKLYIYDNLEEQLGYIDFETYQIIITSSQSKEEFAHQILNFVKYDIEKIVSDGKEIFQILKDKISFSPVGGLNQIWSSLQKNEKSSLTVEFYNNYVTKLITEFKEEFKLEVSINKIIELYDKSMDEDSFSNNIKEEFKLDAVQYKSVNLKINELYWNFRNFFDTVDAIYRVFSIGIIDDFIIDYQNQQFILIVKKVNDTDLINKIYEYISHFTSKKIAFKVFEEIPKCNGHTIIEKVLNFFEKFRYNHIYNKRIRSYELLSKVINKYSETPENIINFLNHYFSEKYLIELSDIQDQNIFELIEKYFSESLLTYDELMHLYKSSEIALNTDTNDNLYILCGLSGILIHDSKDEQVEAIDKLVKGISNKRNREDVDLLKLVNIIFSKVSIYNYELQANVETLFFIKLNTSWLNKMNKELTNI